MELKRPQLIAAAAGVLVVLLVTVFGISRLTGIDVPKFADYPAGSERKAVFFDYFLPIVQERNQEILQTRQQIQDWRSNAADLSGSQQRKLEEVASGYRMDNFDPANSEDWTTLLTRLDVVPPSLALAQAANESAWGTSRFARTAHNYYGQWCFEKGCGEVPKARDTGKTHEVARFGSPKESVLAYMRNLNEHPAYLQLRRIRQQLRTSDQPITGMALAAGLERYSERGQKYIKELRSMIQYNELDQYDN